MGYPRSLWVGNKQATREPILCRANFMSRRIQLYELSPQNQLFTKTGLIRIMSSLREWHVGLSTLNSKLNVPLARSYPKSTRSLWVDYEWLWTFWSHIFPRQLCPSKWPTKWGAKSAPRWDTEWACYEAGWRNNVNFTSHSLWVGNPALRVTGISIMSGHLWTRHAHCW